MAFRVVVLYRGGTTVLHSWLDLESPEGPDEANWAEVARRCVDAAAKGSWRDIDVFVCLLGEHMNPHADSDLAQRVVSLAQDHCWGGAVYMVLDRRIALGETHREYASSISEWFQTVAGSGIAGLVQVPMSPTRPTEDAISAQDLSAASATARHRYDTLRPLSGTRTWRPVTPLLGGLRKDFLHAALPRPGLRDPDEGIVAVIAGQKNTHVQHLKQVALQFPGRPLVAATAQGAGTGELQEECVRHSAPILVHHGLFELRYSLQVLNESPRVQSRGPLAGQAADGQQALLTSGFVPADGEHILHAAREVGELARHCAPWMAWRVHPGVSCERLVELLRMPVPAQRLSDVRVWSYSGHGKGPEGLEQADNPAFCAPERWVKAFEGRRPPDLVLLLACRSTPTAELFGRCGSLAVGFDYEVHSEKARHLAVRVLDAAARSSFDRGTIRGAFDTGRALLFAAGDERSAPRLFPTA